VLYSKLHRHAAVCAALILATSCSDVTSPTEPVATMQRTGAVASQRESHSSQGDVLKRAGRIAEGLARSATIGPDGGFLVLREAGLLVVVPRGALSETTVITATALDGKSIVYDFQPHGLTFATPIFVVQTVSNTELAHKKKRPDVWGAYLDHGTDDLLADGSGLFAEIFPAYYSGTGNTALLIFTTTHFSGYAMGSGMRPSGQ
jgi:hypothetical protein